MRPKNFEEEMCLDQQRVNQTAWEQKYFFEENGFTKEDLAYEEEMSSQYWSEYMTDLEWRNSCFLNNNIGRQCPPPPVGLFLISP